MTLICMRLQISSEEETSSGLSRLIFYNNWKGIYSQVRKRPS